MDSGDIVHVAILPPKEIEADRIQKVASVINADLPGTRVILAGKMPRLIAHYSTMEAAELVAQSLRHLGLTAITCRDTELRKPTHSFRAHVLKFHQKGIECWDKAGQPTKMDSTDAFLILTGMVEIREETEVTKTSLKLNLPATLLTGGIPIRRKVTEKTTKISVKTDSFVRVYDKKSSDSDVEIRRLDFDYSCLGTKVAASSLANFNTLVARIRDVFPRAIFDDRLAGDFGIDLPSTTPWGKLISFAG